MHMRLLSIALLAAAPALVAGRSLSEGSALAAGPALVAGSALAPGPAHAADPELAADYTPVSDAVLGPLQIAPKDAATITRMCDERLAAVAKLQSRLESTPVASEALLPAYDDLYNLAVSAMYMEPALVKDTHPVAEIRRAGEECVQRSTEAWTRITMSRPIYERLQAVEKRGVEGQSGYMLRRQLDVYRRAGVDKDEATRKRIADLQGSITAAALEFDRNISDDVRTITSRPEELAGLPQDYIESHAPGEDGSTRITTAYPDAYPVFRYADSEALRKRLLLEFDSRAHPRNDAVLARLLAERRELARLVGYDEYAALDLASRMVRDPARARRFMDEVAAVARPVGAKDAARMLERLRKDDPEVESLGAWSTSYASRLIRKEEYDVDPAVVRRYFGFDKVRDGLLELTEDLFGVEIRPWTTEVWSPEVRAYEMAEGGQVIGRFFLDMHPREGKFSHAMMTPLRIGIRGRQVPVAVLVTNFPTGLMEHGDVVTFLHEFGHLLHWLFAGQREWAAQNPVELENDALEAPSQLLEEWVWDYETLRRFATDADGEPIPADLVRKMNAARRFAEALSVTQQLGYSAVSLDFYSSDMAGRDLTEAFARSFDLYSIVPAPESTHRQASFGHLASYGAGYYTYMWSKALAVDLLSRFRQAGLRDPETAQRYREMVLAPGGSESMNVLARNFLGRDWSVDAFRAELAAGGARAEPAQRTN